VTVIEEAESYVQIQGKAEIFTDDKTRKKAWHPHLAGIFTGPDDPNYSVLKISPYRIELQKAAPEPPEVWEA
jgi:general stress protein 26